MIKLPLHIAQKLQLLLQPGQLIPASMMQHPVVNKMLEDGMLKRKQLGKTRSQIYLADALLLANYLHNHFGISDLESYINMQTDGALTRATAVEISGDSKLKSIRSFHGFLADVYAPVSCMMQGEPFEIQPLPGSFTFIRDYANFIPDPSITIVGIENAENFSQVAKQAYLFPGIKPLFVSRYPQSNDLVKWLQLIPNRYLHFGDLDFEGINIYQYEFKKWLGERASFFIPPNLEDYLLKYGNRNLYNKQLSRAMPLTDAAEEGIRNLLQLLYRHKKVLEQEIFVREASYP